MEKGSGCLRVGVGGLLGGLQGLGHSGAAGAGALSDSGSGGISGCCTPLGGPKAPRCHHGNALARQTHGNTHLHMETPRSWQRTHRRQHPHSAVLTTGVPPTTAHPCAATRRDAPSALLGTKASGGQDTAQEHHGVDSCAGVSTHQELLLEPAQRGGLAGFCLKGCGVCGGMAERHTQVAPLSGGREALSRPGELGHRAAVVPHSFHAPLSPPLCAGHAEDQQLLASKRWGKLPPALREHRGLERRPGGAGDSLCPSRLIFNRGFL